MPVIFTAGSGGMVSPISSITVADGYVRYATAATDTSTAPGTLYFVGECADTLYFNCAVDNNLMTTANAAAEGAGSGMMASGATAGAGYLTSTGTCRPVCTYVIANETAAVLHVVQNETGPAYFQLTLTAPATPPDLTDAEVFHYQAAVAAREWSRRWTALELRWQRESAARRASALLLKHLTPEQRADYARFGAFNVVSLSRRRYRIRKGTSGNVDLYGEDGRVKHRLCIHPSVWVPDEDTMLAQLLMIRFNEEEFLRLANFHAPRIEDREAQEAAPQQQAG